jgi:hypothetical protein
MRHTRNLLGKDRAEVERLTEMQIVVRHGYGGWDNSVVI